MCEENKLVLRRRNSERKRESAYRIALDNRRFEIENYWRRTTYFWTITGALFVAFGVAANSKHDRYDLGMFIVASLGLVFSLAWFFTNRGSKFWQENWEAHVDVKEDEFSGAIYKTILFSKPVNISTGQDNIRSQLHNAFNSKFIDASPYSVSRLNQIISLFCFLVWLLLFGFSLFPNGYEGSPDYIKVGCTIVTCIFLGILFINGRSSFYKDYNNCREKERQDEGRYQEEIEVASKYSYVTIGRYIGIKRK